MNKRIVVAGFLAVLFAALAYAQATDFIDLVRTGTPQDVQAAINKGADIKDRDTEYGATPLACAAEQNPNPEVITTLLKAGANAKVKDNDGKTALDYAKKNDKLEGTDALKQLEEASK